MSRRLSSTLEVVDADGAGTVSCVKCGHGLSPLGEPWKPAARLLEAPMNGARDMPYCEGPDVVLRRFACPACGALLDSEVAMPGDPFITDTVF